MPAAAKVIDNGRPARIGDMCERPTKEVLYVSKPAFNTFVPSLCDFSTLVTEFSEGSYSTFIISPIPFLEN